MKKIFIMAHSLEIGGAERSLIGLLNAFNPKEYEVDLFLLRHEGELLKHIPSYINLLKEIPSYTVLARPMKNTLTEGYLLLTGMRMIAKTAANFYNKGHGYTDSSVGLNYSHKFLSPFMPKIQKDKEYDLAISFLTPHYFVAQKVNAKKKIAWIHTDYSHIHIDWKSELRMWNKYDYIASISDSVTETFLKTFPSLKDKIILIENILPYDFIRQQSDEFSVEREMPKKGIRFLSIGRFCTAKNFDNVPEICSKLVEKGIDIYWYIIGFGSDENLIKKRINEFTMKDRVILLGKKENPYPYIKACDFYIQPSRYEGKSVTVKEAQLLGKPVIITDYATAKSQLDNGIDGFIVPLDNEMCASEIAKLINDDKKVMDLYKRCYMKDYSNKSEIDKLYYIINN